MIIAGLLIGLGVANIATLFTDAQWGDVQSFLNFCVLIMLTYITQKGRKEIPAETAVATAQTLVNGTPGPEPAPRDVLAESIVDAIEAHRSRRPGERRAGL